MGALSAHPYLTLFVGLLFVGELMLLPAIYLSAAGRLELGYVLAIAIPVTVAKDFGFYYLGRKFPASALARIPGRTTSRLAKGLDRLFAQRGAELLFLSKFVYGTRMLAQILAGVHDMPVRLYLMANTLGVTALTVMLAVIAYSVAGTARRYTDVVNSVEMAFFVFVVLAVLVYALAAMVARRRWSR